MSTAPTLSRIQDRPDVREELVRRAAETADRRNGDDDLNAVRTEVLLKFELAAGGGTLTNGRYELAMDQHACRTHRGAANACDSIVFHRKPCSDSCPVMQERVRRQAAKDQENTALRIKNEIFVTDWYMPEAHQLLLDSEG